MKVKQEYEGVFWLLVGVILPFIITVIIFKLINL